MYSFYKMHGIGNDFVIFDDHDDFYQPFFDFSTLSKKVSQRRLSIGCDQIIFILKQPDQNPFIRFFNNDGSEAENCGNGTRCAAKFYMQKHSLQKITFDSLGGALVCSITGNQMVEVISSIPVINGDIPLYPQDVFKQPGIHVNVGNPHLVILDPVDDFLSFGAMLENHPAFPHKTNVGFAKIQHTSLIHLQVWERGTGPTLACGSGACAAAMAAFSKGLCHNSIQVQQPGGTLTIQINQYQISQTGPAEFVFKGTTLFD